MGQNTQTYRASLVLLRALILRYLRCSVSSLPPAHCHAGLVYATVSQSYCPPHTQPYYALSGRLDT